MTWKKVVTDSSKKYYFTVQNISVIPNSKVYLKIKDTDTPPTDTNGAIVLTSKNYLSSVLPTNSYMYVAEEDGALAGTIVSEVITQNNYNIETIHENKVLTTVGTVVSIPKGALFVLQNVSDNDITYRVQNAGGRGILTKNQIFAIAFAKDTKVTVTGQAGDEFSYIITSSVNMTALDPIIQADIDYIKAHLKTVNSKYITIEALEQVFNQLDRGAFIEELTIRGNNTIEHLIDTVKLNPIDTTKTSINNRSIIEVVGDIEFTNTVTGSSDKTGFNFTLSTNPEDNQINDIYISNKAVRNHIDKVYIRKNATNDKIQLVIVTDTNVQSTGKARIRISGYKLLKDTDVLMSTNQEEVIYKHDNLEFYSKEDLKEFRSNLIEAINGSEIVVNDFSFDYNSSTWNKFIFNVDSIPLCIIELDSVKSEIIVKLDRSTYRSHTIDEIHRIYTIGNKRGTTFTIPVKLFSEINSKTTTEIDGIYNKYIIKFQKRLDYNEFYEYWFRRTFKRIQDAKDENETNNTSKLVIRYI